MLRAVQGRHEAIQKIEQQMNELAQLFQQLDEYVVQQEAPLEEIDQRGEVIVDNVGKGNVQLDEANKQARSRNRKKWWCLLISSKRSKHAHSSLIDWRTNHTTLQS